MKRELIERLRLAWAILRDRDGPRVEHVRREVSLVDEDAVQNLVNVARVFSLEGHSGGSAPIAIGWLAKVLAWEPIAPLTGADDEWRDVSEIMGVPEWVNKRCSRVFKGADGLAYDVQGRVFVEPGGTSYTSRESCVPVVFPYTPTTEVVRVEAQP